MKEDQTDQLTELGSHKTQYEYDQPNAEILETFQNQFPDREYSVVHETDEFTSLCPKTGQPDFATITLSYTPNDRCIESKSLKLYYMRYRQQGSFMETIVNQILDDCWKVTQPRYMSVHGNFKIRGGINIRVLAFRMLPTATRTQQNHA